MFLSQTTGGRSPHAPCVQPRVSISIILHPSRNTTKMSFPIIHLEAGEISRNLILMRWILATQHRLLLETRLLNLIRKLPRNPPEFYLLQSITSNSTCCVVQWIEGREVPEKRQPPGIFPAVFWWVSRCYRIWRDFVGFVILLSWWYQNLDNTIWNFKSFNI